TAIMPPMILPTNKSRCPDSFGGIGAQGLECALRRPNVCRCAIATRRPGGWPARQQLALAGGAARATASVGLEPLANEARGERHQIHETAGSGLLRIAKTITAKVSARNTAEPVNATAIAWASWSCCCAISEIPAFGCAA